MTIPRELSFLGHPAARLPKTAQRGKRKAADKDVRITEPTGMETPPGRKPGGSGSIVADLPPEAVDTAIASDVRSAERVTEGEADHALARPASPSPITANKHFRLFQYQIQGTDAALRSLQGSIEHDTQVDEKR
ncbi:MAG: hypothetical protein K8R90_00345 [Candidatus Cloacimonetes bacterium]|nr:hypothetical protein [Candidatus Cloacimonadota bacterium]